jgi:hypothetical protein
MRGFSGFGFDRPAMGNHSSIDHCMGVILDSSVLIAAKRQGDLTSLVLLRVSFPPMNSRQLIF